MNLLLLMLIILNPFAQVLYLRGLFDELSFSAFVGVHFRATVYSFVIFIVFALFGDPILRDIFQVRLGSLQVFGGLVNLYVSYRYITAGEGSVLLFRGNINDLAPNITLPYMVGPGMLWVSILMGRLHNVAGVALMIAAVLAINMAFVLFARHLFRAAESDRETGFTKGFGVLMRLMALFVGAIGVEMMVGGLQSLFGYVAT